MVGWVTAIVCHFLANYNAVLNDHINRRVIESLGLQSVAKRYLIDETLRNRKKKWKVKENAPADDRSSQAWPDLPPAGWRSVKVGEEELSTDILSEWADPETAGGHSRRLARWVIKPILDSPQNRPVDYAAGILLGPPGTRKTTLVDVLSKMLEWPYVPVPASTIFEKGFDPMEARASEVFRRLNFLTQCVIFFDEFDEFFLSRPDPAKSATLADARFSSHDRTVAAFTTSAMLPRLQDLHDEKRSLIFFATNYFDRIDEAVVRAGRFDFQVRVNHPEVGCFADSAHGYFSRLPKKTLEKLGLSKDSQQLTLIRKAIKLALDEVSLQKLQPKLGKEAADETCRIKFKTIEDVAERILKELISGGTTSVDNNSVNEILREEIQKVIDEEKGPGPLPSL